LYRLRPDGTGKLDREQPQIARMNASSVMMGDNPELPRMPEQRAIDDGHNEKILLTLYRPG
jgi:hypothetical protein